jgi:signal transduction histidine kinase
MYKLDLPGLPSTPERARQSVRDIAEQAHPGLGEAAEQVTADLVSHALHYTPRWGLIEVTVELTKSGITIEVKDPGEPQPDHAPRDLGRVSKIAKTVHLSDDDTGHRVRAVLDAEKVTA